LRSQREGVFAFSDARAIRDWAQERVIHDKAQYASLLDSDVIVLQVVPVERSNDGVPFINWGFIYSCKGKMYEYGVIVLTSNTPALIQSAIKQRGAAIEIVTLQGDHTTKYTREGWTHGSIGCSTLRRVRENISRQFHPFGFSLMPTEAEMAYSSMLEGLRRILREQEDFGFDFDQMVIDHHVGAANAIEGFRREDEDAPRPKVIQCWAHISRQAVGGRHWINLENKKLAEEHMKMLHECRTEAMFDKFSKTVYEFGGGRFMNERENAEWLKKT
jgi:hypothetical protein